MVSLRLGLFATIAIAIQLHFITTPRTPFYLPPLLSEVFPGQFTISNLSSVFDLETFPESLIFDYSYDPSVVFALMNDPQTVQMWSWDSRHSQHLKLSTSEYVVEFTSLVARMNFTKVTLIANEDMTNLRISRELRQRFPRIYSNLIVVPEKATLKFTLQLVGKAIKSSGSNLFAIMTDEVSALNLLKAFEAKRMNKPGFAYVLSDTAAYYQSLVGTEAGLLSDGVVYVAQSIAATARSCEESELMILKAISAAIRSGASSASSLIHCIDRSLTLVNIREAQPWPVLDPISSIVFPGNITLAASYQRRQIPVSVNYIIVNKDGTVLPQSMKVMRGVQVAIEEVNNRTDMMPTFEVKDTPVGLSGSAFDYDFTKDNIIANRDKLGLAHFPPPSGVNIRNTFKIFEELNITLPISMTCALNALSSPKDFPFYVRPRTGSTYTAMVIATMFKFFGWKRLAVLYSKDSGDNEDLYLSFLNITKDYGISIVNSEQNRALIDSIANGATVGLNNSLSEIISLKVRIVLVMHLEIMIVLESMYDLGVRSEYLICTWTGLSYAYFNGNGLRYEKRKIVGKGALQFFPRPFIGDLGAKVLQWLIEKDGLNYYPNTCYYYDSAMLYLHATDYMIKQGIDYEDPYEIVKAMRGTHFKGCTGTVAIAPGSNDKAAAEFSILNAKYFEGNKSMTVEDVMYFNPFSATLFKSLKPIMWPDNSTSVFTDTLISTYNCPFFESETRNFPLGKVIGFSVTFGICLLTSVATALIWKRWWRKRYPILKTQYELSADDLMQLLSIPIEFFQFAAVGPDSNELNHVIAAISNGSTLEIESILAAKGQTYWYLLHTVFVCIGVYVILSVLRLTRLEKKLEWVPLWSFAMLFANLALPVFSNLLFLPFVSCLSKLYLCYHSTGDSLTSSYLNKDCYTNCWSNSHISYVVGSAVALAVYIPLGVYTKPMWQESQPVLHIRAQPLGLMVKSIVQIVLLSLNNTLKEEYPNVHAGMFFAAILAYITFLVRFPPFNYHRYAPHRLNLWEITAMVAVVTFSILALIAQHYPSLSFVLIVVFTSASFAYMGIAVVIQSKVKAFASKFYRRRMDPTNIINFAFSFGSRANRYLDLHFTSAYFVEGETRQRVPVQSFATSNN